MPQQQKKRVPYSPNPGQGESEQRENPIDKELDDLLDEADKIIKKNKENVKKKQPSRE